MTLYRTHILPRIIFIPYWIFYVCLFPFVFLFRLKSRLVAGRKTTRLIIAAGVKGWELIEYKELYKSACEYLGEDSVIHLAIDRSQSYLAQLRENICAANATHYFYDPRTGSQTYWQGLWQSVQVSCCLAYYDVVPIVGLSDLSFRGWRLQAAIVSAHRGIVLTLSNPRIVGSIFPHRRLVGPMIMAFSKHTLQQLDKQRQQKVTHKEPKIIFIGSLYEPRATILAEINEGLKKFGHSIQILGRTLGGERKPDEEYWNSLIDADFLVTTADQVIANNTDWAWLPHLIYRYTEATCCGALLVASHVPGIERWFVPDKDFVSFRTSEEAIKKIKHYINNQKEGIRIAQDGQSRAAQLVDSQMYWHSVDVSLGSDSLK